MRKITLLILLLFILQPSNLLLGQTPVFLDSAQINQFLKKPELDENVKDFYSGKTKPSDNNETSELLITITKRNDKFFPIYFQTLNSIALISDGALSDMITNPCFKMIYNYPIETFAYFNKNKRLSLIYAELLGYEFYFKEKGTSTIEMNFKEFQDYLKLKLDLNDKDIYVTYSDFVIEVEKVMKNMD